MSTGPACWTRSSARRPAEISRDEAGLAAVGVDGVGYRCAAGFAAVHDDLGAVPASCWAAAFRFQTSPR